MLFKSFERKILVLYNFKYLRVRAVINTYIVFSFINCHFLLVDQRLHAIVLKHGTVLSSRRSMRLNHYHFPMKESIAYMISSLNAFVGEGQALNCRGKCPQNKKLT